jgi:hypothetical protein
MAIAAYSEQVGRNRHAPGKYGDISNLYQRSSQRAARTAGRESAASGKTAGEQMSVIGFKGVQGGIEEIALRHDDDVETRRDLITTENLSNQSFSSISSNRVAEFPSGRDPEAADPELVGQQEHRRVAAVRLDATVVDPLEFRTPPDALGRPEFHAPFSRGAREPALFAADG